MGMRSRVIAPLGVGLAIAAAGCGVAGQPPGTVGRRPASGAVSSSLGNLPRGWGALRLATGAALPYPPDWRRISGDPGSASAAVLAATGTIRAYLNVTPAQPPESLSDWTEFRLRHVAGDGDRNIRLISTGSPRRIGPKTGACVTDQYTTTRTTYRELACIVAPDHGARGTVLVAAAQPDIWTRERPAFEFAFSHFTT